MDYLMILAVVIIILIMLGKAIEHKYDDSPIRKYLLVARCPTTGISANQTYDTYKDAKAVSDQITMYCVISDLPVPIFKISVV